MPPRKKAPDTRRACCTCTKCRGKEVPLRTWLRHSANRIVDPLTDVAPPLASGRPALQKRAREQDSQNQYRAGGSSAKRPRRAETRSPVGAYTGHIEDESEEGENDDRMLSDDQNNADALEVPEYPQGGGEDIFNAEQSAPPTSSQLPQPPQDPFVSAPSHAIDTPATADEAKLDDIKSLLSALFTRWSTPNTEASATSGALRGRPPFFDDPLRQPNPICLRADYPELTCWRREDWKTCTDNAAKRSDGTAPLRGRKAAAEGINVRMQWAEDEYGVAVDGYVASDMRNQASAIWASLDLYGYAPRSWAQMCNEARDFYVWRMVKTFPILGLCDSDWKALQIGKDNYHGWQKNHRVGGASELPSESTDNDEEKQQKNQKQADKRKGKERAPGHAQPTTEPDAQPPKRPLAAVERDREDEPPAKKLHVPPDASESETGSRYITLKDPLARPRRKPKNMHVRLADDARPIGASIVPQGVVLDGARSSDNPSHDDQGVDAPQQLEPDVPPSEQSTSIAPANRASASHCADATPTQPGRHSPVSPAADLPPRPVPGTPAPVTPFVPNAKKYKRPGKINGPKTLAGVEWADKNPDGTTAEFDEFYNRLTKDQLKDLAVRARVLKKTVI